MFHNVCVYVCVVIVAFALPFLDLYYQHCGPRSDRRSDRRSRSGLFDLCTVAVRSRSGYLGLTAVHGPLKSSGPRQHWPQRPNPFEGLQ